MTELSLAHADEFKAAKRNIQAAIDENAKRMGAAVGKEKISRNLARVRLNAQIARVDDAEGEWRRSRLEVTEAESKLANVTLRAQELAGQVQRLEDFLKKIAVVTGNLTRLIGALKGL